MEIKYGPEGADVRFLRQEIVKHLFNIEQIFCYHAPVHFRFVITSGNDGKHMAGSKHYLWKAIDCRIWHDEQAKRIFLDDIIREQICKDIRRLLGDDYQVLNEKDHIHIEWDP